MKKKIIYFGACCMTTLFIASCSTTDADSPGFEFMPDMYRSPSYEGNSGNNNFSDSLTNRMPVEGTITYEQKVTSYHPYPYQATDSGYSWSRNLRNPFAGTKQVIDDGKFLYGKFCTHCHGDAGAGDGKVGMKLPGPPPAYKSAAILNLPEGQMYHSIHFGKGNMGSHASQLTPDECWKIIRYVQVLQDKKFDANGMMIVAEMKKDSVKAK